MLLFFIFSDGDHCIRKSPIHTELHKDSESLAKSPEQLAMRIKENKQSVIHLRIRKGSLSIWDKNSWEVPVSMVLSSGECGGRG